jgi:hypothetical protein
MVEGYRSADTYHRRSPRTNDCDAMLIYKILLPAEWAEFETAGRFDGSPFDRDFDAKVACLDSLFYRHRGSDWQRPPPPDARVRGRRRG